MRLDEALAIERPDRPIEAILADMGPIVRRFGDRRDSRALVVGVELADTSVIVKHSIADTESIGWLRNARRFHQAVQHRTITPVLGQFHTAGGGLALIEAWAPGDVLVDTFDPMVADRTVAGSPFRRFLDLPVATLVGHITELLDAHIAVADAGFVAVDFYDGCVVHDPVDQRISLIDLDHYRPGPYVLEVDRQLGSSSLMPPEEFERGATIDERATVHTLGRFALIALGCSRSEPPDRGEWRADVTRYDAAIGATHPDPGRRFETVAQFATAWGPPSVSSSATRR